MTNKSSIESFYPYLKELEQSYFVFNREEDPSLAAAIVKSNLPYRPGIYLIYALNNNEIYDLLYVGKAGADQNGTINTHQVPKRLLATINPHDKYRTHKNMPNRIDVTRNIAFPIMMEVDRITSIKVFCFFSNITEDMKVEAKSNPVYLEREINKTLKRLEIKPKWAK